MQEAESFADHKRRRNGADEWHGNGFTGKPVTAAFVTADSRISRVLLGEPFLMLFTLGSLGGSKVRP